MMDAQANVDSGRAFFNGPSGKWAGEKFLKALNEGRPISSQELRTGDTLRRDEWIAFDEALIEEGQIRLRGVADLMAAGLTKTIPNGLGKTVMQYEKVQDMEDAQVSMDGLTRTENDRIEFALSGLPLPITHKDFFLNLRHLLASRSGGEGLDTTQARIAGRKVAEKVENILFNGYPNTFGGLSIYGYTTAPNRNTVAFGGSEIWSDAGKTGEEILTDVLTLIAMAEADLFFGPYWLYVPSGYSGKLETDFKANSDKSIRTRLMEVDRLVAIRTADQLAANNVVLVQATSDVVVLVEGEPLQTIQWDIEGGFRINFKAFTIQVPLIRDDPNGRSGIQHMRVP